MHGREVLLCDLLLVCPYWAMSAETNELDLLRRFKTGMASPDPALLSWWFPWFGSSRSAYLANRTPRTPTRYARYGLQLARTLCSEMSETALMMLMKTMTEMPWPSRITMSAPLAKQAEHHYAGPQQLAIRAMKTRLRRPSPESDLYGKRSSDRPQHSATNKARPRGKLWLK